MHQMLSSNAPAGRVRFVLAASAEHDTSEELISPGNGLDNTLRGIRLVSGWLRRLCADGLVESVALWIADGFDDRFVSVSCSVASFERELTQRAQHAGDVAPLRVLVTCARDADAPR